MNDLLIGVSLAILSIFSIVVLTGILSGLVLFGLIDQFFRAPIQSIAFSSLEDGSPIRRLLRLRRIPGFSVLRSVYQEISDQSRRSPSTIIAALVGIPKWALFQLPHRQLCGQLIAGISTARNDDRPNDLAAYLVYLSPISSSRGKDDIIEQATRSIDYVQLVLRSTMDHLIFVLVFVFWSLGLTVIEVFQLRIRSYNFERFNYTISTTDPATIFTLAVVTVGLSMSLATVANIAFGRLERTLATR